MRLELTDTGPMLITETEADKSYMREVMGVQIVQHAGPFCFGPQPDARAIEHNDGPDHPWTYNLTYPHSPRCNLGDHLTGGGGCGWEHRQNPLKDVALDCGCTITVNEHETLAYAWKRARNCTQMHNPLGMNLSTMLLAQKLRESKDDNSN